MNDRKLWSLLRPNKHYVLNVSLCVDVLKVLGYYFSGTATVYFLLMVPTNLGLDSTSSYAIAQWCYAQAMWLAPVMVLLLWVLVTGLIGVGIIWLVKALYSTNN